MTPEELEAASDQSCNHFAILETLGNPYGLLGKRLLSWVTSGR